MNNKNKLLSVKVLVILGLLVVSGVLINSSYMNTQSLKTQESIVTKQANLEVAFEVEGYTINNPNVILNPYGNSPLTALVMFETENKETPEVSVKGKEPWLTMEGSSKPGRQHYVPIYGLYADTNNEVVIRVGEVEKSIMIHTEKLPDDIAIPTAVKANKDLLDNQLYFFTPASKGYTSAYDANGDIRWYLTDDMVWNIERVNNGRLLLSTERSINPPYFTTGLYEVDLLGKIYNEYSLPGGYHHDYYELESGNLLVASNNFDNLAGTVEDVIVEVDRETGDVVKSWDLKEILNMEDGKSENWSDYDWFHNNSVWFDKKNNEIILSGRHQDAVVAIDYDDGSLQWIIGDPTGWSDEYKKYFFEPLYYYDSELVENDEYIAPIYNRKFEWQWSQHSAMITPEGYVFILDNGNNKSKIKEEYVPAKESYTRGVIYDIDRENMTIEQIWQYGKERGSEFYSPYISDVDYLGENHYIVHSGGIVYVDGEISNQPAGFSPNAEMYSKTVELLDNKVIFELTLPTNMYRSEKMSLYNNTFFELGSASRLGSLGKTKVSKEGLGLPIGTVDIDDRLEGYNIEIIKEEDRLVFSGEFNKEDKVKLALYNNFQKKEYNVRVSKRPYTALCIDIFTEDKIGDTLEIYKYINDEGLSGDYSVYLEVNGVLYNTGKYINY